MSGVSEVRAVVEPRYSNFMQLRAWPRTGRTPAADNGRIPLTVPRELRTLILRQQSEPLDAMEFYRVSTFKI